MSSHTLKCILIWHSCRRASNLNLFCSSTVRRKRWRDACWVGTRFGFCMLPCELLSCVNCWLWLSILEKSTPFVLCHLSFYWLLDHEKPTGSCGWQHRNHSQEVQGFCRIELTCCWLLWETRQSSQGDLTSQELLFQYPRVLFTIFFWSMLLVLVYYFQGITLVHVLVNSELIFSATTNFVLTITLMPDWRNKTNWWSVWFNSTSLPKI